MPIPTLLDILYRPDLDILTVRWLTDEHLATARADYETVLRTPEALRTSRWLFDVRRRSHTDAQAANWVVNSWLPRAAALRRQPLRLAYLVAPLRAIELAAENDLSRVVRPATQQGQPYLIRIFANEGEAVQWLLEPSA